MSPGTARTAGTDPRTSVTVPTPVGEARITWLRPRAARTGAGASARPAGARPRAVLVLGHGAGGGIEARDLQALAKALPAAHRIGVALVEQPWRVAGKKLAPAPGTLDRAWRAVWEAVRDDMGPKLPLVAGGRSAGARVACRTADDLGAAAVLALSFPLHPPGRPERSRADELLGTGLPTLVVQGERDPFGNPAELTAAGYGGDLVAVAHGDHGFAVPKRSGVGDQQVAQAITEAVADWLDRVLDAG